MLWAQTVRHVTDDGFVVEGKMYSYRLRLFYTLSRCAGCGICAEVCPKDAIDLADAGTLVERPAGVPLITIDLDRCVKCGVCAATCPFRALRLEHEDVEAHTRLGKVLLVEVGGYPTFPRGMKVDTASCTFCGACAKLCPRNAIKVVPKESIEVDEELCIGCGWCVGVCPYNSVKVQKMFEGKVTVDNSLCPEGCVRCVLACPCKAMYSPEIGDRVRNTLIKRLLKHEVKGKVAVENFCILCGACRRVCPVENAIKIVRDKISHTEADSDLWIRTRDKLLSGVVE